ncbi:exosortase-associated EpsI family protein [Elusimicrobiota bacterium]
MDIDKIIKTACIGISALFLVHISCSALYARFRYATDTNQYYFTSHEGKFSAKTDFFYKDNMSKLPMNLGAWEGSDIATEDKLPLFFRSYENKKTDGYLYLLVVFGREESKFHTAEVCYINDGWKLDRREYTTLKVNGEPLGIRLTSAKLDNSEHLIAYWYMWPKSRRRITDGCMLMRLSIEVYDNDYEAAGNELMNFIKELSRADFGTLPKELAPPPKPNLSAWTAAIKKSPEKHLLDLKAQHIRVSALNWLKEQIVPNRIVRRPAYDRRNLLISYRIGPEVPAYEYVFSKSAIYDNALAVIAFTMVGDYHRASLIIDALERLIKPDGDLYFTFNTHNSWPNPKDEEGTIIRSGASAWMGYAIVYYLATRLLEDKDFLVKDVDARRYLALAQRIANRQLSRIVKKEDDPRKDLITGGWGSYKLKRKEGKVVEEFESGEIAWASVEHNIDFYFFLRDLGRLTNNEFYKKKADKIADALLKAAWHQEKEQFGRGVLAIGRDTYEALDCASWGASLLAAVGEKDKSLSALKATDRYLSKDGGVTGYKPYASGMIYESRPINKFYFSDYKSGLWENYEMVWPEGTLGVAMAYVRHGDIDKAQKILTQMAGLQDEHGGILYSTQHLEFQFSPSPSVASTAWAVMAAEMIEDPVARALFWGL